MHMFLFVFAGSAKDIMLFCEERKSVKQKAHAAQYSDSGEAVP